MARQLQLLKERFTISLKDAAMRIDPSSRRPGPDRVSQSCCGSPAGRFEVVVHALMGSFIFHVLAGTRQSESLDAIG